MRMWSIEDYPLPNLMLFAGLALLTTIMLRQVWRRSRQRTSRPTATTPRATAPDARQQDKPLEMIRWEVEMQDMARDVKAELDSKMRALQALLHMAQQERERLETLLARIERTQGRDG